MCCICYGTFRWYGGFSKQILTYGCLQSDLSLDELHFFFSNIIHVCWKNRSTRRKPRRYRDSEQTMSSLIGKLPKSPENHAIETPHRTLLYTSLINVTAGNTAAECLPKPREKSSEAVLLLLLPLRRWPSVF